MAGWSEHIETKVRRFLEQINLPLGSWLDFGCGQGSLTGLLSYIHPHSKVEGADISPIAVKKASLNHPSLSFFVLDEILLELKYDLIFSHHVLEHVLDLERTLDQLDKLTNPCGFHCHILPCGNAGSFEWEVARNTQGGFQENGRFFFEEDGHLRRLTSQQLIEIYQARGYNVAVLQFANQYYGAFRWLIDLGPDFIRFFANPKRAKNSRPLSAIWLRWVRIKLLLAWSANHLASNSPRRHWKRILYPLVSPFARLVNQRLNRNRDLELVNCICNPAASEMLVCFQKI